MSMRKTKIDYLSNQSYNNSNNNNTAANNTANKLKTKTKTFNLPSTYATTLNESNKLICSVLASDHHNLLGTADSTAAVVVGNNLNLPCPGCARIIHYPTSATAAAKNGYSYGNCCGFRFSTSTINYTRPSRFVRHKRTGSTLSLSTKLSSSDSIHRKKHLNTQLMVRDKAPINNQQQSSKKINPDQLDVSKTIYILVRISKKFNLI